MNNKNTFDRFIEDFSAVNLKKRVWGVSFIGVLLCIAIVIGGYFFLNSKFSIIPSGVKVPFWELLWRGR